MAGRRNNRKSGNRAGANLRRPRRFFALLLVLSVTAAATVPAQPPRLEIAPARPDPGGLVRLTLAATSASADSVVEIRGSMAGEPLHFMGAGEQVWRALGAVPVDADDTVSARVLVYRASGAVDTVGTSLAIAPLAKPSVTSSPKLAVSDRFTRPLDRATLDRIKRENERAREVGRRAHEAAPRWTAAFLKPRASRVTSRFGTGRAFNNTVASRHLGVDFAGAVGAPVRAANRGVVALVDTFFLAGNVIYLDHGAGVVTGYFHLSESLVTTGDTVSRGQTIGRVGATGRVTGAHLHWSARYGTLAIDPLDLVGLEEGWYSNRPAESKAVKGDPSHE
jgi:murein DD-endopeptidase MepM/ murein hydrolase activator NlpD